MPRRGAERIGVHILYQSSDRGKRIGTIQNYDGDRNGKIKKAIGLMSKTTTLHLHHAFLYIAFQSLHNYEVE